MKIETKTLDLVEEVCQKTELLSIMTWQSFVSEYCKTPPLATWYYYFTFIQKELHRVVFLETPLLDELKEEIAFNHFKLTQNQDKEAQKQFYKKLRTTLKNFITPTCICFERSLRWAKNSNLHLSASIEKSTNLFMYLSLTYRSGKEFFHFQHLDLDIEALVNAIDILKKWEQEIYTALTSIKLELEKSGEIFSTVTLQDIMSDANEDMNSVPILKEQDKNELELTNLGQSKKLTWNCKPAIAGYIISELVRAGYLEPPTTNSELSYNKLGAICEQIFAFSSYKPTIESWRKALNPDSNTLPDIKRIKLKITDLNDLN